ncbi:protein-L-isoaspartate O-methyltransferase [Kitasatospora sp. MAP12-15]|uniref:protein-L-isoaspartate O-methyltransferase family protein n=1 Tax=unclassified Kitasatospora TaxID=2633591 RepID=UPI002476E469|nr:methyltransferase domain-containing protein [Kitasatospora sp. MAP12-44]MDH6111426.1 protein-L-isoaspartate O-methyltransferase [Kitasatospora sp. MAP12-44]
MTTTPRSTAPSLHAVEDPPAPARADTTTVDAVPSGFALALAAEPGVHDPMVIAAVAAVPRHRLIPRAYQPLGEQRPATRWRLLDSDEDRAAHRVLVYSMDQVVVQLADQPAADHTVGAICTGRPAAQSSGAGLLARTLQDLRVGDGDRFLELGACTGYLSAAAHRLTRRQVTGVECDRDLVRQATPRLHEIGADVRLLARDALRGLPDGTWDKIAASFSVPAVPAGWLRHLAPGGLLRTTVNPGAPGWHATALIERDKDGAFSGTLSAELWGHVPARGAGWLPVPEQRSADGATRTAVLPPPPHTERGFWVAVGHLLPGVRRFWNPDGDEGVLLVGTDGSRAHIAPDGATVTEWGPRNLWQLAEDVHERWTAAGRPDTYRLELTDQEQRIIGGPGLHWVLPL